MAEVARELLEPAPVALARPEVLPLVAAEPLLALDRQQPDHRRERQRERDQPVDPARVEREALHSRASAASAKWRAYGAGEVISKRTAAT